MVDPKNENKENFIISKDLEEEVVEEDNREDYYGSHVGIFQKKAVSPFLIGGVAFIVLVILLVFIISRSGNVTENEQLQALETRIQQLESKLATIGVIDQALDRLAEQEKKIDMLSKRVERSEASTKTQIDQIIKELGLLHQKTTGKPEPKAKATQPAATGDKEPETKFHQVRAGETLYGISQKYGLTVKQLQNYNNMGSKATIRPGQKLRLTPDNN